MKNENVLILVVAGIALVAFLKLYQEADAIGSDISSPVTNTLQGIFNWFS